jgi:hypothetical protein
MHDKKIFNVGDTVYVPAVEYTEERVRCPDCLGEGTWIVSTPSSLHSMTIACPRCKGGAIDWLLPRKRTAKTKIAEVRVSEVTVRERGHKGEVHTSVTYGTSPYSGWIDRNGAFRTHEEAETAAALLMVEHEGKEKSDWEKERERELERAGRKIVDALNDAANERASGLEQKISKLKEEMLGAIRWPTIDGPKITTKSYGGPEILAGDLAEWLNGLLNEADIVGISEEEIHEATCHC